MEKKSKWIERTLGINMERLENIQNAEEEKEEVYNDINNEESKEITVRPKKYLRLRKKFSVSKLNGRAIGNVSFSESNRDWFAATYFSANSKYSTDSKKGCIGIWNFMLPQFPEYILNSNNMITSTHFHPTSPFLVFGSTINGQILMWDLRTSNNSKPIERSNFSNGHSAPVFTMSFLPNIKQKQAE